MIKRAFACIGVALVLSCTAQHLNPVTGVPSHDSAVQFSEESVFAGNPVGVHKPWLYLNQEELTKLESQCLPLVDILKPYYKKKPEDVWGLPSKESSPGA